MSEDNDSAGSRDFPLDRPRKATIQDVADLAGVSTGTVSNTINRPHVVRRATREAVERAIRELGFVPNQQASVLAGAASHVIGLVVLDIASPFYMQAARAVERAANEAGHMVVLCNSENNPTREAELLRMLNTHHVRGVILAPASEVNHLDPGWIASQESPIVFLDDENTTEDCSVCVDHVAGASLAARHLIATGRDRLAFVGDPDGPHQFAQRFQGVRNALVEADLPSTSLRAVRVPGIGLQDGLLAADQLLERELPSGILCGNDMMAFGVYRGLTRAGVRIPDDAALIGYDDVDFAADWVVPLTSVRQPTYELGYQAAQLLLRHSGGDPDHQHQQLVLQPELIVRSSTDPGAR